MKNLQSFALTRAGNLDPSMLSMLLQKTRSAFANVPAGTTFLTVREDGALRHLVLVPRGAQAAGQAFQFAQATQARSEEAEPVSLAHTRAVVRATYDVRSVPGSATQAGGDVRVVAQTLSTVLRDGEWVAVTVRKPWPLERRPLQRWVQSRTQTHHSLDPSAVLASVTAGASDSAAASNIVQQAVAAIPGWDYPVRVRAESGVRATGVFAGVGALLGGAGYLLSAVHNGDAGVAYATAAVAGVAAVAAWLGWLPVAGALRARMARSGAFPAPRMRAGFPRPPRGAHTMINQDGTVSMNPDFAGDYPLARPVFMLGPVQAVAVAAPHSGAASGAAVSKERVAPPALRIRRGPALGTCAGAPVFLSDTDRYAGLFITGGPGSGKSLFLLTMWGYDAFARTNGAASSGGNAMIWFDTKMDSQAAQSAARLSRFAGDKFVVIRVGDPNSRLGLELLPTLGSAGERGREMAAILRSVLGEGAIAFQSQQTLQQVFTGGFAVADCPAVVAQVPGLEPGRSAIYYADVLLENKGVELSVALFEAVRRAAAQGSYGRDVAEAHEQLLPIFDRTPSQRTQLFSAPRSKTDAFMQAEQWWSRPTKLPWELILRQKLAVIIDFGGANGGALLNPVFRDTLAAMMLHTLRGEIERVCGGWLASRQSVTVYADEVKYLAGASPDVVSWFRNDGRAFGVCPEFATQFPEQLDGQVRETMLGFGTVMSLSQSNPGVAAALAAQFALDGTDWQASDLTMLGRFEAAVTTTLDNQRQPAFTSVLPAEAAYAFDATQFAALEGFDGSGPAAEVTGGAAW